MSGTEKYVQPGVRASQGYLRKEIKARPEDQKTVVVDGKCSMCKAEVTPPGNFCVECGAVFVTKENNKNKKGTQFLASRGGRVEMKTPQGAGSEVDPDPAGRHDADAVKAALKDEEGKTKVDWDREIARSIDVSDMEYVPGKGYIKKKGTDKK